VKLVFVTQVLDAEDAVLGFVVRWLQGLARACEAVRVIALEVGDTTPLPDNVDWRIVGRKGRLRRYLRYQRFLNESFRSGYDTLLTHMVPRYSILGDRAARRHGAGHFLWYTHKGVDARLLGAVKRVDKVFTASAESMRVQTDKKVVTGHGIDLEHFPAQPAPSLSPVRLLSVGRLTPAKDPLTLLRALAQLRERGRDVELDWVGGGLARDDDAFAGEVRGLIDELELGPYVRLRGALAYREIPAAYGECSLFVSTSLTGSVDKVVLEAMASSRLVLTCNESFPPILSALGTDGPLFTFAQRDHGELALKVEALLDLSDERRADLQAGLRKIVESDHEVDHLMARLVREMESTA